MKRTAISVLFVFFLGLSGVLANKTNVEVSVPSNVKQGDEITIVINVSHKGNSNAHHTNWVCLKINGKEVQRWAYAKNSLPSAGEFTVEYKVVVTESLYLEVQGNCNIHGSTGLKTAEVKVEQ